MLLGVGGLAEENVGWWYASAIAVGLFFNLFYWNASFWAMTAISNQVVILFAMLAARSVTNNPAAVMAPLCWALLAIGSQFNGLLVLPALLVSNVCGIHKWKSHKCTTVFCMVVFFNNDYLVFLV